MKNIQKISILLAMIIVSQTSNIMAPPSRGGGGNRGNGNAGKLAVGGTAHSNNQQQQQQKTAGVAGLAAASQSSQSSDSSDGSSGSAPTTPPTTAQTTAPTSAPEQSASNQPALAANTPVPTSIPTSQTTPAQPEIVDNATASSDTKPTDATQDAQGDKEAIPSAPSDIAHNDLKTIAPDQDEILHKLKTIDQQDSTTHQLFSLASMDQLFNNFVYFKDFLVKNFTKDKMLSLATELINQIYPKENAPTINMISTKTEEPAEIKDAVEVKENIPAEEPVAAPAPVENDDSNSLPSSDETAQSNTPAATEQAPAETPEASPEEASNPADEQPAS